VCGVASIVEAMSHVRGRLPNAVLIVVDDQADPAYRRQVRELVDRLALGDRIKWIGAVGHEQMPDLYRLADVTVSVARSDGVSYAILESMAVRRPVVVGDIPNYAGIFSDRQDCRMVDPCDPRSIADGIVEVLADAGLRAAIVRHAHAKIVEYADLAREAQRIAAMLSALAMSRSRSLRLAARLRHALNLPLLVMEPDARR
jgi:glycosyltransferase involved in cell wall biosynthesis